jgi:hypothetical protein
MNLLQRLLVRDGQVSYRRLVATLAVAVGSTALLLSNHISDVVWADVVKWSVGAFIGGTSIEHAVKALRRRSEAEV